MPSPIREALRSLLSATDRNEATERVFREMARHNDWYVTIGFGINYLGMSSTVKNLVMLSPNCSLRSDIVHVFTDLESAVTAGEGGAEIGAAVSGVSGRALATALVRLPETISAAWVNLGMPDADRLFLTRDAFAHVGLWSDADYIEMIISVVSMRKTATHPLTREETSRFSAMIRSYNRYFAFRHRGTGQFATFENLPVLETLDLNGPAYCVATAPDHAAATLSWLRSAGADLEEVGVTGEEIVKLRRAGGNTAGILFNMNAELKETYGLVFADFDDLFAGS